MWMFLRRACLLSAALLVPVLAFAQTGTLAGTVLDKADGLSIIGANVRLAGTTLGSTTDLSGGYEIRNVPAGTHTLEISYLGYTSQTITGVEVRAGQVTRIDLVLTSEAIGLAEVTVEARALRNNETTLLRDRQKAMGISDAISAEAISRSGAGDAAAAMSKVTGASVVGGRYVYVRGLGDRYSTTQLNGAPLPSADPDRQSFQLDLLPSNLLDNIVTLKTFTPDRPGNFSGGLVNVGTKDFPDVLTFRLSYSAAYVAGVTADNILLYEGSGTDWLGRDDGARDLPESISKLPRDPNTGNVIIPSAPSRGDYRRNADSSMAVARQISGIAQAFSPAYQPAMRSAPTNQSVSVSFGNKYLVRGQPLGITASVLYARSASAQLDAQRGRYRLTGGTVADIDALQPTFILGGARGSAQQGSTEASLGGLLTLAYRPTNNHSVSATYLQTQSGSSEARLYSGYWDQLKSPVDGLDGLYQTRVLQYQERSVRSVQLKGASVLGRLNVDWNLSGGRNTQDEPDLRYFTSDVRYAATPAGIDTTYQVNAGTLYEAPTRYFRDLKEDTYTGQLDFTLPFAAFAQRHRLKVGGYYQDIGREFRQRRFLYDGVGRLYDGLGGNTDTLFSRGTGIIGETSDGRAVFGMTLSEATALRSLYDGDQTIGAGYAMLDLQITPNLRVIGGARLEKTDLKLTSLDSTVNFDAETGARVGVLDNTDVLPAASIVYALADNMNLRAAATQTLARPTFRELAPYANAEFVGGYVFTGNPTLKRTLISNYDLRWEWFFRPGEIVAVSGFYKGFQNPIERVIRLASSNDNITSQNVEKARVYGIELEARKGLGTFTRLLEHVSVGANVSLIRSFVSIPQDELDAIRTADPSADDTRPLNGQSPYVVNLDLGYERGGTAAGVFFNQVGDRLTTVVDGATPDIFERARPMLDASLSQKLGRGLRVSFRARNLLDARYRETQQFKGQDYVYSEYRSGRSFSLGVSYSLD